MEEKEEEEEGETAFSLSDLMLHSHCGSLMSASPPLAAAVVGQQHFYTEF